VKAAAGAADRAEALAGCLDLLDSALVGVRVLRARVLRARGRLPEAAALLSRALGGEVPSLLFPRRQALAHLAGVLLEQGDPEGALTTVMRALSTPAEDVRSQVVTQRVLAQVLLARGDVPGAVAAAAEALRLVRERGVDGELGATRKLVERIGAG
jgi:predicted Zn-dependent protease